jgi:uncharacterized protein (TIGR02147 family)
MEQSVFEFTDPIEFLNASFAASKRANPKFSLRSWAKHLGLNQAAMLSMVLQRKRKLLPSLSSKISAHYRQAGRFSETEARYFDILVVFANATTLEEKSFYQNILSTLRPDRTFALLHLDQLRLISDWYHIAILEMTGLKDFTASPRWICERLGDGTNPTDSQVRDAIDRLLRLGLLEKDRERGLKKTSAQLTTPTDIPNNGLQRFHSQMIQKSLMALAKRSVHDRDVTGHTLVISRDKLPEAKRMIRKFRRKFMECIETPHGDDLYQLNIQLFSLLGDDHVKN